MNKKYSKDPKSKVISLEEFFDSSAYFENFDNLNIWDDFSKPEPNTIYYKFTSNLFICIVFKHSFYNYGLRIKEKLTEIIVSYRDGETEYCLINNKIEELESEKTKIKKLISKKRIDDHIASLIKMKSIIPDYEIPVAAIPKNYESYLIDTEYKTNNVQLKNKYIVLDVETNGLRTSNDDLLSLSLYDPTTGICYNRFLPLNLQPLVLTTHINGITDKILSKYTHMSQDEINWICKYFNLKDKIILVYSGGKGLFDLTFLENYLKRNKLYGFDNLNVENIKSKIPKAPFGSEGELTKDNLCRMFSIDGVNERHSGLNDCILEWKLYECLNKGCYLFIENNLYQYTDKYIIPYTYLYKHPELIKFANIRLPRVQGIVEEIYKLTAPNSLLKKIKKFPTNITGITLEHAINSYLKAVKQENISFLSKNKSHLKFIGSLDSSLVTIPIITEDDGTVKSINSEYQEFIEKVNDVSKSIMKFIEPLADYIKINIFKNKEILSQELSITNDRKILTLCDLSDDNNVIEIKTSSVLDDEGFLFSHIARQIYFQANGRQAYLLNIKFKTHRFKGGIKQILDGLEVLLFKVELSIRIEIE